MIPRGSLLFGGFGDAVGKILSPAGLELTVPATFPSAGVFAGGVVALDDGTICGNSFKSPFNVSPHFYNWGKWSSAFGSFNGDDAGPNMSSIASNYTDKFFAFRPTVSASAGNYVFTHVTVAKGGNFRAYRMDKSDGCVDTTYDLGVSGDGTFGVIGADSTNSFIYWAKRNATLVTKFTISGSSSATFATAPSGTRIKDNGILVLRNGNVLIAWGTNTSAGSVILYDPAGSVLFTYSDIQAGVVLTPGLDDTTFWSGAYDGTAGAIRIRETRIADGVQVHDFQPSSGGFEFDGPFAVLRANIGTPAQFVPAPLPVSLGDDCKPLSQLNGAAKGLFGCNPGGIGFLPTYAGPFGDVPDHDDPVDGELLTGQGQIDVWTDIIHTDYPSDAITHYPIAFEELADDATYYKGRKVRGVTSVGVIEHGLGNEEGGFEAATTDSNFSDAALDRLFRDLLETQDLEGDEQRFYMASTAQRTALLPPRVLMRGSIQRGLLQSPMQTTLTSVDSLFADYGPFGPNRRWPALIPQFQELSTETPADVLASAMPVLYGEKSDEGATDPATGAPRSKGLMPGLFLGYENLTREVAPPAYEFDTTQLVIQDAGSVTIPGSTWGDPLSPHYPWFIIGAIKGGTITSYAMGDNTLRFPGNVPTVTPYDQRVVWTVYDSIDLTEIDSFICWMYDAETGWDPLTNPFVTANPRYKIIPTTPQTPPLNPYPTSAPYDVDHSGKVWEFSVDWTSTTDGDVWPPAAGGPITVSEPWGAILVLAHPTGLPLIPYGSDLGARSAATNAVRTAADLPTDPNTHDRIRLDPDSRTDLLMPYYANWPFPEVYREYTDADGVTYWLTIIYATGPLLDDHLNGVVNLAFNGWGVEDVGDGTGLPLTHAERCKQHWLENFLLNRWTSGLWTTDGSPGVAFPAWEDGTPKVRTSSFRAREALFIDRFGGLGLTYNWYAGEQRATTEWVRLHNLSTESRLGVNGHGQLLDSGLDELDEPFGSPSWPRIDHVVDIFGPVRRTSGEERENVASGSCDWDPDTQTFRNRPVTFTSAAGVQIYKGHKKQASSPIDSPMLADPDQFAWVLNRRLARLYKGTTLIEITGTTGLLDYDVGTGILLNTIEGTGPIGYVDRPCLVMRRRFDTASRLVTLTLWDLQDVLIATLFPDASIFTLLDEDSSPPEALELGDEESDPITALVLI